MTHGSSAQTLLKVEVWGFFLLLLILNTAFVAGVGEGWIPEKYFPKVRLLLLGGTLAMVVFIMRGPLALFELIKPLFVVRISPLWFLAAFMLPIVYSVSFVVAQALVTQQPIEILGSGFRLLQQDGFLYRIFLIALIGEIVWVGYALRNLSKFHSLQMAAVITGTFWSLWWLPMVYYNLGVVPGLSVSGLWMNMVGIAFFCAFFYTLTQSGLVILAMQFCFNSSLLAFPVLPIEAGALGYQIYAGVYMVLGFLALTVLLPKFQERRAASASVAVAS